MLLTALFSALVQVAHAEDAPAPTPPALSCLMMTNIRSSVVADTNGVRLAVTAHLLSDCKLQIKALKGTLKVTSDRAPLSTQMAIAEMPITIEPMGSRDANWSFRLSNDRPVELWLAVAPSNVLKWEWVPELVVFADGSIGQ